MKKEHLKVGDTIWLKGINNYKGKPLREFPITKVGRKYFYVKVFYDTLKFSFETFEDSAGNFCSNYEAFISEEEYLREVERRTIWRELCDEFSNVFSPKDISLERLREIKLLTQEQESEVDLGLCRAQRAKGKEDYPTKEDLYGKVHLSERGDETLCGIEVTERYCLDDDCNPDFLGEVTCLKCKRLKEELNG